MRDLMYATTFKNEQGLGVTPIRAQVTTTGTVLSQTITSSGYVVSIRLSALNSHWTLAFPTLIATKRYMIRNVRVTPTGNAWATTIASIFGLEFVGGKFDAFSSVVVDTAYNVCVVTDLDTDISTMFMNGRLIKTVTSVDASVIKFTKPTQVVANHDFGATITNVLITQSDDFEPMSVQFVDQALSEVSNDGWSYTGASLVSSMDKDSVVTATPNASTYSKGKKFVVSGSSTGLPQLVEAAGSIASDPQDYALLVTAPTGSAQELGPFVTSQSAARGLIFPAGDLTVTRQDKPFSALLETTISSVLHVKIVGGQNVVVDWGDGPPVEVADGTVVLSHEYQTADSMILYVSGEIEELEVAGTPLHEVGSWGNIGCSRYAFYVEEEDQGSPNLSSVPPQLPSTVTSMRNMFRGSNIQDTAIGNWNIVNVTDLASTFRNSTFDQELVWNTSNVVTMNSMFRDSLFNRAIGDWVTDKVADMDYMFANNSVFNQSLRWWCVERFEVEPTGFADGATAWTEDKPVWGTCETRFTVVSDMDFTQATGSSPWVSEIGPSYSGAGAVDSRGWRSTGTNDLISLSSAISIGSPFIFKLQATLVLAAGITAIYPNYSGNNTTDLFIYFRTTGIEIYPQGTMTVTNVPYTGNTTTPVDIMIYYEASTWKIYVDNVMVHQLSGYLPTVVNPMFQAYLSTGAIVKEATLSVNP